MYSFTLDSSIFNSLLKRIILVSSSDPEALISFLIEKNQLKIFYHSKLDKGLSTVLFYEEVPIISSTGDGLSSVYIHQFFSIKVPEFVSDNKYPQCKEVIFKFLDNILNIEYSIKWIKNLVPNKTTLNFPLLEKTADLEYYSTLLNKEVDKRCVLGSDLAEGIAICNFIKSDVTSKDSNGILLLSDGIKFSLVSTDSTIAIKWFCSLLPQEKGEQSDAFSMIVSNQTLTLIKNFVLDSESIVLEKHKQHVVVCVKARRMLIPIIKGSYLIENIDEFFKVDSSTFIGSVELKPLISAISTVSNNNKDIYKKVELKFSSSGVDIKTDINSTLGVPVQVSKDVSLCINADYLLMAAQKLFTFGYTAQFFYDGESHRITFSSMEDKLVFLIQGLSY